MSHRQCGSQGKWPVALSEETNALFTLPFISINSVCVFDACEAKAFVPGSDPDCVHVIVVLLLLLLLWGLTMCSQCIYSN